jgi:hypothetical protein
MLVVPVNRCTDGNKEIIYNIIFMRRGVLRRNTLIFVCWVPSAVSVFGVAIEGLEHGFGRTSGYCERETEIFWGKI